MTEEQLKKRAEGYAKKIEKELLEDYETKEDGTTPYFATIPTPHNRQAFIDGYHECQKEHEWHYVKDELPELYKDVLVVFPRGDCDVKRLTNHNEWVGRDSWCSLTDVIAWKEIVLPKESK